MFDKTTNEDEDQLIQELYRGMEKMQKRIEALETLLDEKKNKE